MYYVQKSGDGYYLSPVAEGALFSVETLPDKPCGKKGYMVVLAVDEAKKRVWYEYKRIAEIPTMEDDMAAMLIDLEYRTTLLELNVDSMEVQDNVIQSIKAID